MADYPPHQPAVDGDHRAGHIIRKIGREKPGDLGAIFDRPEPPKGVQFGPIAIALHAAWSDRRHDPPCRDQAGRDTVFRYRMSEILG